MHAVSPALSYRLASSADSTGPGGHGVDVFVMHTFVSFRLLKLMGYHIFYAEPVCYQRTFSKMGKRWKN